MNKEELISKLKLIIKPYTTNTEAYDNLTVDIVLDIEEAFDVVIDNTDMERMLDVKTAVEIIETKLAAK
jgi:acyl carrier protein